MALSVDQLVFCYDCDEYSPFMEDEEGEILSCATCGGTDIDADDVIDKDDEDFDLGTETDNFVYE
jgi:hypothetical protein